jgi:hypothetical protein
MMKSLRFALEAAVKGARGSRVQLTTVSPAPRRPDVAGRTPNFHPPRAPRPEAWTTNRISAPLR